jgi:hypothetical protein
VRQAQTLETLEGYTLVGWVCWSSSLAQQVDESIRPVREEAVDAEVE